MAKPGLDADQLNSYLDWLDSEMQSVRSYHDHKEQMAWTATAFYLAGAAALPGLLGPRSSLITAAIACVLIMLVALAAILFVSMQFSLRWKAADQLVALRRVRGKLISGQITPRGSALDVPDATGSDGRLPGWPQFILQEIGLCERERRAADVWHVILLAITFRFGKLQKAGGRIRSEAASYVVIALGAIFGVLKTLE